MLIKEERQELDGLRKDWVLRRENERLVELERKDAAAWTKTGAPFERGLPPLSDRLAHPGPWDAWESPMDYGVLWFSPSGMGYQYDRGNGLDDNWTAVNEPNWEGTWMRRRDESASKPSPAAKADPEPDAIPNPRTCGVARARAETEFRPGLPPEALRKVWPEWDQFYPDSDQPITLAFTGETYRAVWWSPNMPDRRIDSCLAWGSYRFKPRGKSYAEVEAMAAAIDAAAEIGGGE